MKKVYFTLLLASFSIAGFSQITIESGDMPNGGESFLISQSSSVDFNGEDTGENYTWDFTNLIPITQDTLAFTDINNVPFIYQFVFNNPLNPADQATEGQVFDVLDMLPGFELTDVFLFANNTNNKKEEVGIGATINGAQAPVAYENKKLIYNFPLNYNGSATDDFNFSLEVPNTGFVGQSGSLTYDVDGWGTLLTSFGTFDVLRVKRVINRYDTVYVSSSGFGFGINREITEYEWLGKNTGIPLLKITTEFGVVTAVDYQDFPLNPVGIEEIETAVSSFSIYPQPADGKFNIGFDQFPKSPVKVSVFDLSGKQIWSESFDPTDRITINESFNKGIYLIDIRIGEFQKVKKLIIQ